MVHRKIVAATAALALAGFVGSGTAGAQTSVTTTTTTKTVGGITSQTTVTKETSVLGEPSSSELPAPRSTMSRDGETSVLGEPSPSGGSSFGATAASPATEPSPTVGVAPTASSSDRIMTKDGIRYACAGVGLDSRSDPRWNDFAAKVVFTIKGGGYLPDVLTTFSDGSGNQVFSVRCDGPWLLVDLPADTYRINATATDPRGQVHERTGRISVAAKGQRETIIRFDDIRS